MLVLPCNCPVYCDVDATLLMFSPPPSNDQTKYETIELSFFEDGPCKKIWVNHHNVNALKEHKLRKHTTIVWSAGGWQWAERVIKILNLEEYVDCIIQKPSWIIDDLAPEDFMPKNYWKGPRSWLKQN
jgi:hypothetical protein